MPTQRKCRVACICKCTTDYIMYISVYHPSQCPQVVARCVRVCALHRELKDNPRMLELVLPNSLSREELTCAADVATELGLRTEKVNNKLHDIILSRPLSPFK